MSLFHASHLSKDTRHAASGHALAPPFPAHLQQAVFGMGCFWGAERRFWPLAGVWVTAVGYAGGKTQNPSYREVCTSSTDHAEVVLVVFDPTLLSYEQLLDVFWHSHNPTQGMRQGNDIGSQYRSVIHCFDDIQLEAALASREAFQKILTARGYGAITTQILPAPPFYYAESAHQQYLQKNPNGYCGLGGLPV